MAPLTTVFLSLLALPLSTLALPTANSTRPQVKINAGVVVGVTKTSNISDLSVNAFLGVPFAAKPVRWAPPKPHAGWSTPLDASTLGPACIQQFNYPEARRNQILKWFNTPPAPESEDCLNAAIYVPASNSSNATKKAVMVWFYGGGLLYGSNFNPLYDGETLAANEDVIVVAPNYRTNVFGFSQSPLVPLAEVNPGWLDQRFALDWVQKNIAAFGGDPDKVTIFGESAGGASIDALLTLPPNPLTFRAAIMESGTSTFRAVPANSSASWDILVAGMNCSSAKDILACMRAVPATTIKSFNQINRIGWTPLVDNVTYSYTARSNRLNSTAAHPGKFARVPILGGTNADEGRLYSISANDSATFIRGLFPAATDAQVASLLAAYPINGAPGSGEYLTGTFNGSLEQLGALYTDFIFQCPARIVHLETAKVGVPSWRYYYNASFPNTVIFPDSGVYHSSEIGLVFGTYPHDDNTTVFQEALSRYIQNTWASFAKNPLNWTSAVTWPAGAAHMGVLGGGVRAGDGPDATGTYLQVLDRNHTDVVDKRCDLYQSIYDALGH